MGGPAHPVRTSTRHLTQTANAGEWWRVRCFLFIINHPYYVTVATRARRLLLPQICLLAVAGSPRVVGRGLCRHTLLLDACPIASPHTCNGTAGLVTPPRPNHRPPNLDAQCKSPSGAARAPAKENRVAGAVSREGDLRVRGSRGEELGAHRGARAQRRSRLRLDRRLG